MESFATLNLPDVPIKLSEQTAPVCRFSSLIFSLRMTLFGNFIENKEDIRNNLTTKLTVLLAFNTFNKPFNV